MLARDSRVMSHASQAYWEEALGRANARSLDGRVHPRRMTVPEQERDAWIRNWKLHLPDLRVERPGLPALGTGDYSEAECVDFTEPLPGQGTFLLQAAKPEHFEDTPMLLLRFCGNQLTILLQEEAEETEDEEAEETEEEEAEDEGADRKRRRIERGAR